MSANREARTAGVVLHPDRESALAADRREGERFEHAWRVDAGRFGTLQASATAMRLPIIRADDVYPLDHRSDASPYQLWAMREAIGRDLARWRPPSMLIAGVL